MLWLILLITCRLSFWFLNSKRAKKVLFVSAFEFLQFFWLASEDWGRSAVCTCYNDRIFSYQIPSVSTIPFICVKRVRSIFKKGKFKTLAFCSDMCRLVLGYAYPAYECFKTVELNKPEIEQLRFWCQYW